MERAAAYTRSHQATEGEVLIVRRAKAFKETCQSIPAIILDHELIVGGPGVFQRSGSLCPEVSWKWLAEEVDELSTRNVIRIRSRRPKKRCFGNKFFRTGRVALSKKWSSPASRRIPETSGWIPAFWTRKSNGGGGVSEITPEFDDIIFKKGFAGIRRDARKAMGLLEPTIPEAWEKICFYRAVMETCDGIIEFGRRYARQAEEMAGNETDPIRRAELEEIARVCHRIPEFPPESFREAIQMVWFVMIGCALAENGPGFNLGRFDQYMQPYFEADLGRGAITREQAQELVNCLWIKLSEWFWLLPKNGAEYFTGYNPFQNCTIGGRKKDGSDAVNDVSYMCLEATTTVRLPQPALSIRIDSDTGEDFLRAACRLSRLGTGFPAFHNDRVGAEMMQYAGLPPDEARDWSLLGCVVPHHRKIGEWTDAGAYNMAASVEFALNEGKVRLTGKQVGLQTEDPREFKTYDDFKAAVIAQLKHIIRQGAIITTIEQEVPPGKHAPPLHFRRH